MQDRFDMTRFLFYGAAMVCALGALAHEIIGAPMVLEPLSRAGLPNAVIWLHHFSWHVGTLCVIAMAAMFVLAASKPSLEILAVVATGMSIGLTALAIGLALFGNSVLWSTPAPYPWSLVAALGAGGLVKSRRTKT
jgi:hypothetical protein